MVSLAQTINEIKSLKIQGATNVARSAISILSDVPQIRLNETIDELISTRPTEPLLQNCLNLVKLKGKIVIPLILARLDNIEDEIVKNGASLIKNGDIILTHCHSSSVVKLFKYTKKKGVDFKVYLTETRPVFQGRITAGELTEAGINSTMITDSEASFVISKEDNLDINTVFLGADAIDKNGSIYNKVGSYGIALSASKANIPIYIVSTLLKFSVKPVIIEERKGKEVWSNKPKNLKIFNPAFDKVPAELITGLVSEFGIIKPKKVKFMVKKNYPWILTGETLRSPISDFFGTKPARSRPDSVGTPFVPQKSNGLPASHEKNSFSPYKSYSALQDSRAYSEGELKQRKTPYRCYLHLNEKVNLKNHIMADFILTVNKDEDFLEVAGGIATESSIGTWTQVTTQLKSVWEKLHARVLKADKNSGSLQIAYPLDLFEKGNIPQLLSSIAGNVYGLKEASCLRLDDINLPENYVKTFPGPAFGIDGIRKITGVYGRPLIGCIIKPKLGLDCEKHSKIAKEVYEGGIDFVKDDENLTSQEFNPFEKRVSLIMKYLIDSHQLNKIYAFNVTAPSDRMLKRANFIKTHGGNCAMIDFLTAGFSGLQSLRSANLGLIIHGHRAMHAALDRIPNHGISMLVLAKLGRLAGLDSLHSGTVIGKMEGGEKEIININKFLLGSWYGLKPVLPVASGGLYPGLIPDLIKILGKDILLNFGGGIHGHPQGSKMGAIAVLAAVKAYQKGISFSESAKTNKALAVALEKWPI
ncbi:MAG: ribulose-bisphosphate carboxylase large subunit [Candidatus Gottesmanbacteria bacterium]